MGWRHEAEDDVMRVHPFFLRRSNPGEITPKERAQEICHAMFCSYSSKSVYKWEMCKIKNLTTARGHRPNQWILLYESTVSSRWCHSRGMKEPIRSRNEDDVMRVSPFHEGDWPGGNNRERERAQEVCLYFLNSKNWYLKWRKPRNKRLPSVKGFGTISVRNGGGGVIAYY